MTNSSTQGQAGLVGQRGDWRRRLDEIRPSLLLALGLLVVVSTYVGALAGEFVWDDKLLLSGVERTLAEGSVWRVFAKPFWFVDELEIATRGYYRPLSILSFAFDYLLHHRNSAGFRVTNLVLHLLNTVLLFRLCLRNQRRGWVAALVATTWAIQPRLAESVAWISGRTDVLCSTFALGALLIWRPTFGRRVATSVLLLLALLAKETAIAAVTAVIVLELSRPRLVVRRWLQAIAMPVAAAAAYALLRSVAMHGKAVTVDSLLLPERLRIALEAVATYAWILLDPWQPRTQIGSIYKPKYVACWCGAVLLLLATVVLVRYFRRLPREKYTWMVLAVMPLVLVSHIIPVAISVVAADRFLYVPTIALAVAAADIDFWSWRYSAVLSAILGLSLVPRVIRRAQDWSDPVALWSNTCLQKSSRNGMTLLEIGNLEFDAGNYERSLEIFSSLLRVRQKDETLYERVVTNQAIALSTLGRYRDAQKVMEEVVREFHRVPKFWYDLATTQMRNGDVSAAKSSVAEALTLMPNYEAAASMNKDIAGLEKIYVTLKTQPLELSERAFLEGQLGFFHEAEADWLAVISSNANVALRDQGLAFVVEHGSHNAVDRVAKDAEQLHLGRPEIIQALLMKKLMSERLKRIPLNAYGIVPEAFRD